MTDLFWLSAHQFDRIKFYFPRPHGVPRVDGNGVPETRQCLLRLSQCEILDTWHTMGLRGTGSNDILVRSVFVPEEQTFSFQDPALVKRPGPLHVFPYLFLAKGPARRSALPACRTRAQRPMRCALRGCAPTWPPPSPRCAGIIRSCAMRSHRPQ